MDLGFTVIMLIIFLLIPAALVAWFISSLCDYRICARSNDDIFAKLKTKAIVSGVLAIGYVGTEIALVILFYLAIANM